MKGEKEERLPLLIRVTGSRRVYLVLCTHTQHNTRTQTLRTESCELCIAKPHFFRFSSLPLSLLRLFSVSSPSLLLFHFHFTLRTYLNVLRVQSMMFSESSCWVVDCQYAAILRDTTTPRRQGEKDWERRKQGEKEGEKEIEGERRRGRSKRRRKRKK